MPRCMCVKFESDICIPAYFFRITKKIHPCEDNNWYLHHYLITDIYTAAHPCKYQLLPELLFFENYFFENIFLNIFLFLIYFFVIQKI